MSNKYVKTGISIKESTLKLCDSNIRKADLRSRSEFISYAIEFYCSYLDSEDISKMLSPALESVIGAKILNTENHIARVLYKQGIELAMMMNVIAATNDIQRSELHALQRYCEREIRNLHGSYTFDDAVKFQKEQL